MKLTVLGKYGPFPKENGATSSYLLQSDKTSALLDVGSGAVSRLSGKTEIGKLGFIILSHLHFDHVSDLGVLSYALSFSGRKEKLNVYLPNFNCPVLKMLQSIKEFNLIFIEEGKVYKDCDLSFSFYKMTHPVLSYGVKVSDGKSVFAYSGDTTLNENLLLLLTGCNFAVLDGAFLQRDYQEGKPHMSILQASKQAKYVNGKVLISHVGYKYSDEEVQREIKSVTDNCDVAVEGKTYEF